MGAYLHTPETILSQPAAILLPSALLSRLSILPRSPARMVVVAIGVIPAADPVISSSHDLPDPIVVSL